MSTQSTSSDDQGELSIPSTSPNANLATIHELDSSGLSPSSPKRKLSIQSTLSEDDSTTVYEFPSNSSDRSPSSSQKGKLIIQPTMSDDHLVTVYEFPFKSSDPSPSSSQKEKLSSQATLSEDDLTIVYEFPLFSPPSPSSAQEVKGAVSTSSSHLHPLAQLQAWLAKPTAEPFEIAGGIPPMTIYVHFTTALEREELEIIPGITNREKFLVSLAERTNMGLYNLEKLFIEGKIEGFVMPKTSDPQKVKDHEMMVEFFRLFCDSPALIKPVSIAARNSFVDRFPSKMFEERIVSIKYHELPPITIYVQFPEAPGKYLEIPEGITTRGQFLEFLDRNVDMTSGTRKSMYRTGKIGTSIVQPINTDQLTVDSFKEFLRDPKNPIPLLPPITVGVKFPGSKEFFLDVPPEISSQEQFTQSLIKAAVKARISSGMQDVKLNLCETDSRSVKRFKRLTGEVVSEKPPVEALSITVATPPAPESKLPIESLPIRTASISNESKLPAIKFMEHPVELPQVDFKIFIGKRPGEMHAPYDRHSPCRSLQVPPKINSLEAFKEFIKETLAREGKGVLPNFSIWNKKTAVLNDYQLKEVFSSTPVVLHICGTCKLVAPKISVLKQFKTFVKEFKAYAKETFHQESVLSIKERNVLPIQEKNIWDGLQLPQGKIEVVLPWTLANDDWDDCHLTVNIASQIRSLKAFKLLLTSEIRRLRDTNLAEFDVMCMRNDIWERVESTDQLMRYFEDIQMHSISRPPSFACVERKLPQPDQLLSQPSASRALDPEPMEEPEQPADPMFEGWSRALLESRWSVLWRIAHERRKSYDEFVEQQPEKNKREIPISRFVEHFSTVPSRQGETEVNIPKRGSSLPQAISTVSSRVVSTAPLTYDSDVKRSGLSIRTDDEFLSQPF